MKSFLSLALIVSPAVAPKRANGSEKLAISSSRVSQARRMMSSLESSTEELDIVRTALESDAHRYLISSFLPMRLKLTILLSHRSFDDFFQKVMERQGLTTREKAVEHFLDAKIEELEALMLNDDDAFNNLELLLSNKQSGHGLTQASIKCLPQGARETLKALRAIGLDYLGWVSSLPKPMRRDFARLFKFGPRYRVASDAHSTVVVTGPDAHRFGEPSITVDNRMVRCSMPDGLVRFIKVADGTSADYTVPRCHFVRGHGVSICSCVNYADWVPSLGVFRTSTGTLLGKEGNELGHHMFYKTSLDGESLLLDQHHTFSMHRRGGMIEATEAEYAGVDAVGQHGRRLLEPHVAMPVEKGKLRLTSHVFDHHIARFRAAIDQLTGQQLSFPSDTPMRKILRTIIDCLKQDDNITALRMMRQFTGDQRVSFKRVISGTIEGTIRNPSDIF